VALTELIDTLLDGHHLEGAQLLRVLELLHVQGSQTGVVKASGHDPERIAHEDLVHPMAGHQVGGGQLHIVPRVRGRDGEHVVLDIRQKMMGLEERQGKRVKPEQPKQ
jgi:hypothetical protein